MYTVTLDTFEGPLDLLLQLIERAELDITTIALARVADQYLAHVRALEAPDPRALADFVALAARLLLIKSRALLPRSAAPPAAEAADADAEQLAQQLREYQRFKQAATLLRQWQDAGRQVFLRTAAVAPPPVVDDVVLDHTPGELVAALTRRIQLQLPLEEVEVLPLERRLTVGEVVEHITSRLVHDEWVGFATLFSLSPQRQEVTVTFWAVLELLKRRVIVVEQQTLFGPLRLGRPAMNVALQLTETVTGDE